MFATDRTPYYEGLEAICAWFARGSPPHPRAHLMINVWVYEADGQVRVKAKWTVCALTTGALHIGDYDDVMIRIPDGWRIALRVATVRDPA